MFKGIYKMNFSFNEQPQNSDFMQKFNFKISIFGFYRNYP
ncbi:hypothetical protein LEP1GSC168_3349 [Leptospira santarosai str. HAI134]|uniref:Uncharacterized protein n=1 Tax=Leptospira santarosai serovar Arenal str. MAVJ 401 TaxID=1049976 RepID=M6JMI2_9LEPT|nr:hypothetical protein LEP1GSC063_3077 [Leptospira santarosai serovar Arenal str. MAVJ 401]EMO24461.1 hypothetical protein LEP1GSC168_3349 [Leptospira santarosai str. HAI134]